MSDVIAFPNAAGWCRAAGQHLWLPAWCEGDHREMSEWDCVKGTTHGAQFWWCEVCNTPGLATTAPEAEHPQFWELWRRARWRVFATSAGAARLVIRHGGHEVARMELDARNAKRLAGALRKADGDGRKAALQQTGQDRWRAERTDDLVLASRGTIDGPESIYLRRSVVFPNRCGNGYSGRRCTACRCHLPPAGATEQTPVWRGAERRPAGRWAVQVASNAQDVLFCCSCVETMLADAESVTAALQGVAGGPTQVAQGGADASCS